ncbi:hypothetical protein [Vibrio harveyi]|uniref:hypothetical protein n=1 Tax=Vibrio harveyi TaxID=669 RepID=UPI0018F1E4B6|nr:hypothetical protein [Vibrio harveyi]
MNRSQKIARLAANGVVKKESLANLPDSTIDFLLKASGIKIIGNELLGGEKVSERALLDVVLSQYCGVSASQLPVVVKAEFVQKLIADLEQSKVRLTADSGVNMGANTCQPWFDACGNQLDAFGRKIAGNATQSGLDTYHLPED